MQSIKGETISKTPSWLNAGMENMLVLGPANVSLYLGRYLAVNTANKYHFILSYTSDFPVTIQISEHNNLNERLKSPTKWSLPQGNNVGHELVLTSHQGVEKIFIKFEILANATFALRNISIEEVQK